MALTLRTTPDRVLKVARDELDTRESPAGSNRTKYGRMFGLDGNPWCAMFVWWVFREAGAGDLRELLTRSLAYTPAFANACKAAGWKSVPVREAARGDIAFFDFPDSVFRIQHIGIVDRRPNLTSIITIEGNTSLTSQDNGGAVMRRTRPASYVEAIYRPVYEEDDMPSIKEIEQAVERAVWSSESPRTKQTRDFHLREAARATQARDLTYQVLTAVKELSRALGSGVSLDEETIGRAAAAALLPDLAAEIRDAIEDQPDRDAEDVANAVVDKVSQRLAAAG